MKWFLLLAVFFGVSALALDAFFAHGLRAFLGEYYDDAFLPALTTAARYQLTMSILLFGLVFWYKEAPSIWLLISASFISLGLIFFCMPIYLKYLCQLPQFSGLAPGGGVLLMASLLALLGLFSSL